MRRLASVTMVGAFTLVAMAPAVAQQANPCAAKSPAGQKSQEKQNPCAAKTPAGRNAQNPCAAKTPAVKNPCAGKAPSASPGTPSEARGPVERDSERHSERP
jgi:hypothetical protein